MANYLIEYYEEILKGNILVGEDLKKVLNRGVSVGFDITFLNNSSLNFFNILIIYSSIF